MLDNVKTIFVDLYQDQVKKPHTSAVDCPFDDYFDQQVRELEIIAKEKNVTTVVKLPLPSEAQNRYDEPPPLPGLLQGKITRPAIVRRHLLISWPS